MRRSSMSVCAPFLFSMSRSTLYSALLGTITTSLKFFAPARISEMPPMSILRHLLAVALVVAAAEYASKHFRVQRLDASAQY